MIQIILDSQAAWGKIGNTPVRAAFGRLEMEGLVTIPLNVPPRPSQDALLALGTVIPTVAWIQGGLVT